MTQTHSITEWGLSFAMTHNLEVRPGNEGEVGPPRGFSLHVRDMEHGQVFRYDPEGKPQALLTWLPQFDAALVPVMSLLDDPERGFLPTTQSFPPYSARRWKGTDRAPLMTVMEHLVAISQAAAIPDLIPPE